MYQAETEDMLPRPAPLPSAPSASLGTEQLVKPQVPEVSLLYGPQHEANAFNLNKVPAMPTQTYAAWRKQVLPKVTFPPEGSEVTGIIPVAAANTCKPTTPETITTRSNLYPMRTIASIATPASTLSAPVQRPATYYRRSLENVPSTDDVFDLYNPTMQRLKQKRRSMESITQGSETYQSAQSAAEVLTICASTQTDFMDINYPMRDFATKEDLDQILNLVQVMRDDQTKLLQLCERMLKEEQKPVDDKVKIHLSDASIQCELTQPATNEQKLAETPATALQLQPLNNGQVPIAPVAQSTAYRVNTPRCNRAPLTYNNVVSALPKPSTEKSMIMNELALKYLPNEKLTEILQELHLQPIAPQAGLVAPLRAVENIEKSPPELSNASYKYLKKYRLLPDEHADVGIRPSASQQRCEPLLDLEHIRNQPKFL